MTGSPPVVSITFCTQCKWLLRSSWYAQELLSTFATSLGEVRLVPGEGGVFRIEVDGDTVWDRKQHGGFPEIAELKVLVRDHALPGFELGHIDRKRDRR